MSDEVQRTLGRIEGAIIELRNEIAARRQLVEDIDKRTTWLERKFNWASGIATAAGIAISIKLKMNGVDGG